MSTPTSMNAASIDQFGGLNALKLTKHVVAQVKPGEVLIKIKYASVGTWDVLERESIIAEVTGETPPFPHILGSDGSGTVAAVGDGVTGFKVGDQVYAMGPAFYAEYVSLDANVVSLLPQGLDLKQAGGLPIAGLTAMQGLLDELEIKPRQIVPINGVSGDTGHLAVQLARLMGAKILAIASGEDGVEAVSKLGAGMTIDGRTANVAAQTSDFAPGGLDAVLTFISGETLQQAISHVREGGRVAYPLGVEPEPNPRNGVEFRRFDLTLGIPKTIKGKMTRLNRIIDSGPFEVKISGTFPLQEVKSAQQALSKHRIGKILLPMG